MSEAYKNGEARAAGFSSLLDAMLAGGPADAVKAAKVLIDDARPEDLVAVVDKAVEEGVDFSALKPAVSKLVNLLSTSLARHRCAPPTGERLFSSLMAENAGLIAVLDRGKPLAKAINDPNLSTEGLKSSLEALRAMVSELGLIEAHYRKKENVIFPWFEAQYPEYRCVRLMWEIQDDARRGLKELSRLLDSALEDASLADLLAVFDPRPINQVIGRLYFDMHTTVFREECALFPVMLGLIGKIDSERLFEESSDYGYAFIDKEILSRLAAPRAPAAAHAEEEPESVGGRQVDQAHKMSSGFSGRTGSLPQGILGAMFSCLPVDMTYVDANDKVGWFSDSPHRIFPRSPSIIGRDVRNCHPGASVDRVVAIIESFKAGKKEREAFWIVMGGRFIHIEYFALRSPEGEYLGVLEASQDLTGKRALSGEKRLADQEPLA
ncbi:MAG: PAS domain-containing protein [Spirochaetia bacterium]|jgi:DUF438 domain-containing protein|nr:PAS domain-containing protein [Spirochaetia bacterium]